MEIQIIHGKSEGETLKSAFDGALFDAGVHNFNLIPLSSIVPPGSEINYTRKYEANKEDYGKRLYVVMACNQTDVCGEEVYAGIGWAKDKEDNKGIFVEHHSNSSEKVNSLIRSSITEMEIRRNKKYEIKGEIVTGITCNEKPVCALTIAVYKHEGW